MSKQKSNALALEMSKTNKTNETSDINKFINLNTFRGNLVYEYRFHVSHVQHDINTKIMKFYQRFKNSTYYLFYVRDIYGLNKRSFGEFMYLTTIGVKLILDVNYKLYKVNEIYLVKILFKVVTKDDKTEDKIFEGHTDELCITLKFDSSKIILNNNKINIKKKNQDIIIKNNDMVNVKITEIKQLQKENGFIDKLYCMGELV